MANRHSAKRENWITGGSHLYLAIYWAEELAAQDQDAELKASFAEFSKLIASKEEKILDEINSTQGAEMDLGGYYFVDDSKASKAMRPSDTLNSVLASL